MQEICGIGFHANKRSSIPIRTVQDFSNHNWTIRAKNVDYRFRDEFLLAQKNF